MDQSDNLSVDAILKQYQTDQIKGLSAQEAHLRLERDGLNVLPESKPRPWFFIFLSQFQSPLIYLLLCAALLIFFMSEDRLDAFIISGVLFFNAIVGTIQEGRTARIVESLKQFIETTSIVLREGKTFIVNDALLVVGDIILLKEGERVPADARVIEAHNLQVDQAVLTGESLPIRKYSDMPNENHVFKGTYIISGAGKAVVTATGLNTEIGKIHAVIEDIHTDVPLRKDVDRLSYIILVAVLVICSALFVIGYMTGKPLNELFVMLTALFICVVPEGLPVVLTMVLVAGVYRMAKEAVLVKNMQAVETLGRTEVIVVDKTGTLTRNEMMVAYIYVDETLYTITGKGYHVEGIITLGAHPLSSQEIPSKLTQMGCVAALLNTAELTYNQTVDLFSIKGDPTEAAMAIFAKKIGLFKEELLKEYKLVFEIPFDPFLKYHASMYKKDDGSQVIYILGAPEVVCPFAGAVADVTVQKLNEMVEKGVRVIAAAERILTPEEIDKFNSLAPNAREACITLIQKECVFLGFFGLEDTIRADIKYVIAQARAAGLQLVMATGDHEKTALYVAQRVGIYSAGDEVLDGTQIDALDDITLADRVKNTTIYSRVSPLHKMRIIEALHANHKIVAMTGDGINDAPSLVAADLGIAMGRIGTEVAKQASDIILLNDSLASIIHAIEQGRHIFYTLKRVILYFFATNMGEILIVVFALVWELLSGERLPLPITAAQILWLNLVTDGFLDVSLSLEPQESDLLFNNWLETKPRLVDWNLIGKMFFFAIPMGVVSLGVFLYYYQTGVAYARTMTLITMAMFQWFNAWNCRSNTKSIFQLGLFTNKWLVAATSLVLFLQLCILHIPFLQHIFKTVPLSISDWGIIIGCTSPILILEEIRKLTVRAWYGRNRT